MKSIQLVDECIQFLKKEFDISDINDISAEALDNLYDKLGDIECDENEYTECNKNECAECDERDFKDPKKESCTIYSYRGQLASAIITEIGYWYRESKEKMVKVQKKI